MAANEFHRTRRHSQQERLKAAMDRQHHSSARNGSDDNDDGVRTNEPALLPQSELAERALIGAALSDERVLETCGNVKPRYFFRHSHQLVWEAMQSLRAEKQAVDYISASEWLSEHGKLEDAGGIDALIQFGTDLPPVGHAPAWAETVCKRYYARFMLDCNAKLAQVAYRGDYEEMKSAWALQYLEMQEVNAALGIGATDAEIGPRHQLKSITEMRDKPRPDWLIPNFLQQRKRVLVFGDSNTGKSFLGVDLGLTFATGLAWHGKPVKQGAVVYVCAEGADDIAVRVDAWLEQHHLADAPHFWIVDDSPNLLELGDVSGIITQIKETLGDEAPAMVIFDTLTASMPGGDQDKQLDMGIVIGAIHRVQRECDCSVLVVHHTGKDVTRGPRGSNSLRADVDLAVEVSVDEKNDMIVVRGDKARYMDKRKIQFGFRLQPVTLEQDTHLTSCILMSLDAPLPPDPRKERAKPSASDQLFALMQEVGPQEYAKLADLFVIERKLGSKPTFDRARNELLYTRRIEIVQGLYQVVDLSTEV